MLCRFLDGSIDMLDEFMTASASCTDEIYHLHKTGDMGCSYYQNRSAGASASGTQHQDKAVVCQAHLPQQGKIAQLQDRTAAPATSNQHQEITAVPVLHKDSLSYQQFVENFMQPNLPVMIQVSSHSLLLHADSQYPPSCYMAINVARHAFHLALS